MFETLKNMWKLRQETTRLKRVPSLDCNAALLGAADRVTLDEMFASTAIEAAWMEVMPTLRAFEIPDGTGGVNPGDRRAIFYLVSYFQPCSVLEVGTHIGASTVHIAAAMNRCRNAVTEDGAHLISVDAVDVNEPGSRPWLRHGAAISPAEMISRMGCNHFAEFVTCNSLDYMRICKRKFDFIFLDGNHAADVVYREIPAALRLLNQDGVILLHDFFPGAIPLWSNKLVIPGPFLATQRLKTEGSSFDVLPLGRLPWSTKLRSNVTSLALLIRTA